MFWQLSTKALRKPTGFLNQEALIQPSAAVGSTWVYFDITTYGNDANLKYPNMVLQPGQVWWEQDFGGYSVAGAFQYVKATANLAVGQLCGLAAPDTGTITAAGSSTATQVTSGTYTVNAEVGNPIYYENGGTNPQMRIIKANAANSVTVSVRDPNNTFNANDADALPYTPTNGTNYAIIRPYDRIVCTASLVPQGVALGAVTATVWTVVQVAGIALVKAVGNGTALVVNQPAVPSASGVIIGAGGNQGAAPVLTLYNAGATIIPLFAFSGAGPQAIPCSVNLLGAI